MYIHTHTHTHTHIRTCTHTHTHTQKTHTHILTHTHMHSHSLTHTVDKKKLGDSSATDVNSYYNRKVNGIFIPAGILQQPFYARDQPVARNYGRWDM